MLKKIMLCAILALQFAVISTAANDWPDPSCPPAGCPAPK
jgi:hypothetical protein